MKKIRSVTLPVSLAAFLTFATLCAGCSSLSTYPVHPQANAATDRLLSDDSLLQVEARTELLTLGEGAMPQLRRRMDKASSTERLRVLEVMSLIGKPEALLIEASQIGAQDSSPEVRRLVAFRAGHIDGHRDELASMLQPLIWDDNDQVQAAAITTLGAFDEAHGLSDGQLRSLLSSNSHLVVATTAGIAITNSDPTVQEAARAVLPELVGDLASESPLIRAAAIIAIGKYGPLASPAAGPLVGALSTDPIPQIRLQAALAIMRLKNKAAEAVAIPALQQFALDSNPALSGPAQRVLLQSGQQPGQAGSTPKNVATEHPHLPLHQAQVPAQTK
jgi:HEAT repeat protein